MLPVDGIKEKILTVTVFLPGGHTMAVASTSPRLNTKLSPHTPTAAGQPSQWPVRCFSVAASIRKADAMPVSNW